jgi:uncharacterized protein with HEPN domain
MSKEERSILQFLYDIIEFATGLQRNISSLSKKDFFQNEMAINYAERNFEKIGEAISQIQKRDSEILFIGNDSKSYWEIIKGMRNRIIHEYWGTSLETIYDVCASDELAELQSYVQVVIDYLESKYE